MRQHKEQATNAVPTGTKGFSVSSNGHVIYLLEALSVLLAEINAFTVASKSLWKHNIYNKHID